LRLLVQHRSHYGYPDKPAFLGPHTLRLHPAAHAKAEIETYSLVCEQAERIQWSQDPFGNRVARVSFDYDRRFSTLDFVMEMAVEIRPVNPFDFFVDDRCAELGFTYPKEYLTELRPFFTGDDPAFATGKLFDEFLKQMPDSGKTVEAVVEMNRLVNQKVKYVIREEAGVWTPEETLQNGKGSCRDSAVLLCALMRRRGLAARFASGYLIQVIDEGMIPDLPKGLDKDVVDLHAWAEVYIPGGGWIGLDATSGLMCSEGHIPIACASTPALAAPLNGTAERAADDVWFEMTVGRVGHEPQPSKPYTDEVWEGIKAAGRAADKRLEEAGIVLTMGGEPTFCARENTDAPEWNTDALGSHKWRTGLALSEELRRRLMPGGALMHRMGKFYPGESLPRWALDAYGRRDGQTLWKPVDTSSWRRAQRSNAQQLAERLAKDLGLADKLLRADEDPWHFIHQEGKVPPDQDPKDAELASDEDRARLARVLNQGLAEPAGWVLPLVRQGQTWLSDNWTFRRGRLFLIPGDSPVGLRLPLDSLSGVPFPVQWNEEPYEPRDPRRDAEDDEGEDGAGQMVLRTPNTPPERATHGVHTAMSVEYRRHLHDERGALFVFMPPLTDQSHFIDLVERIDRIRQEMRVDVMLEGYPPPKGQLLHSLSVTPDPGVLEVNIPPTANSTDYVELMESVYDAGLHAGLHTEKYQLDGRQAGSGGGHHLTLGGPSPLRSPFLQRPELLAGMITFVQHHPSLSYMFTGLFVGPTSQAPRPDEARHEMLTELEIALDHAYKQAGLQGTPPPWLADMLFRHLMVDMTGNTHRAEISIDKLFDPNTPHGRQGILEFRAFEMPPHPQMAIAQMLLLRSLVAAMSDKPYRGKLVRWGQALHDRFLLPHYLWSDFEDVLTYLDDAGLPMHRDAYRPFIDLRCPNVGRLHAGDVTLEVRNAIEPWNVLGEEPGAQGTSRYVDSSMERIELRVDGLVPERHAILVNGRVMPLRPTECDGRYVGGVKFRAWAPPHSLHAHLGIHHPLHIDVLDLWAKRSIGACTYHVWHPEGQGFVKPPLTQFEAAARRSQRFTRGNQSPFPVRWDYASAHPDAPYTLDLRRYDMDLPMPDPRDEDAPLESGIQAHNVVAWPGGPRSR